MLQIINQAHFKAPGDGVDFPFHQDSVNRGVRSSEWRDGLPCHCHTANLLVAHPPSGLPTKHESSKANCTAG